MKRPGGWLWKLRFCWGSHPRTYGEEKSGTREFPCSSVGATPYWGKGQQVKKIYISYYNLPNVVCMYVCLFVNERLHQF